MKQCPICKIYTEKNEGCNHMTCTECKFQWCWLCEGEYNENHFSTGSCNGLQFAKINYLSEKDRVRPYLPYRLNHIVQDKKGKDQQILGPSLQEMMKICMIILDMS